MNFAVSTTAFRRRPIEEVIALSAQAGLMLEFSSGLPHRADMPEIYAKAPAPKLLHNYFPAPKDPFVLNLASLNDSILARTLEHCRQCLEMARATNTPFYSIHAGFCLDPDPKVLGKPFDLKLHHPIAKHWQRFLENVRLLCKEATAKGVKLLIENNVTAPFNLLRDGTSPLLCSKPDEVQALLREINHPALGILIDTGHWKVSSHALRFPIDQGLKEIAPHTLALHHSDNDGTEDVNHPIDSNYWFLRHMKDFSHACHVLEVHDQTVEQIGVQRSLLENACTGKRSA